MDTIILTGLTRLTGLPTWNPINPVNPVENRLFVIFDAFVTLWFLALSIVVETASIPDPPAGLQPWSARLD
jgi:hypothetical protein